MEDTGEPIQLENLDGILLCGGHTVRFGGDGTGYCRVCYLEAQVAMLRSYQTKYDDLLDAEHGSK